MTAILIRSVEVFILRLTSDGNPDPRGARYRIAEGRGTIYAETAETLFVRLEAEDGTVGWGECLAPVAARVPGAIIEDLFAPILVGVDARDTRLIRSRLAGQMSERGHLGGHQADALAAVDIALWDLVGRTLQVPIVQLLGGAFRREVPIYVSHVPGPTDQERVESVERLYASGVRRIKIDLLRGNEADLATFDACAAVARDLQIAVDAHGALDNATAHAFGRALDERHAWFLESPLPGANVDGHVRLATALSTPIAAGETFRNRYETAQWLACDAIDLLQPDIGRTGISEGSIMTTLAATAHRPVLPHHSVALGVALSAGLHVAAAAEQMSAFEYQPRSVRVAQALLTEPFDISAEHIALPEGPGLGITVDEDKVRSASIEW